MLTVGSKLGSVIQSPVIRISYVKQQDIRKRQQKLGATSPVSGFMWGIKQGAHAFSFNIGHMHYYCHRKTCKNTEQEFINSLQLPTSPRILFSAALITSSTATVFIKVLYTSFAWCFKKLIGCAKAISLRRPPETGNSWASFILVFVAILSCDGCFLVLCFVGFCVCGLLVLFFVVFSFNLRYQCFYFLQGD